MNDGRPSSNDDRRDRASDANGSSILEGVDTATRIGRLWSRIDTLLRASGAPDPEGPPAAWFDPPPLDPVRLRAAAMAIVRAWREPSRRAAFRLNPRQALASAGAPLSDDVEVALADMSSFNNAWREGIAEVGGPIDHGTVSGAAPAVPDRGRPTIVIPIPPPTAPPLDEGAVRRLLSDSPHAWVIWAAFGPFTHEAPPPEALQRRRAAAPVRWRASIKGRWPALAMAAALAAVGAILVLASSPSGGDLAGTAAGPWYVGRILVAIGLIAGAVMIAARQR